VEGRELAARALERSTGRLATLAIARLDERLDWYRGLAAQERSWVGLVIQAGIAAFVAWFREPRQPAALSADVFGSAPRELTRAVTLQQTVQLARVAIEVVEEYVAEVVPPAAADDVRTAVLQYSREVAFAAADVYARAAEARGAWDARLEALVVDGLMRGEPDEELRSRAAALGWTASSGVTVLVGRSPARNPETVADAIRRAARLAGLDVLLGVQGERLVAVLGGAGDVEVAARAVAHEFADGPVVVGPLVPDLLAAARSARSAVAGLRAVAGWPAAPRPVAADALLPERALNGDGHARRALVTEVYGPLVGAGPPHLDTLSAFLESGGSVEGTARALFVHANTVRYRLRRVLELTGLSPTSPRDAYTLHLAVTLGRLMHPQPELELGTDAVVGTRQGWGGEVHATVTRRTPR
jgi:hypothetical protein